MRVPLAWLKEFVTWDISLEALCERLTYAGLEIGSVEKIGAEWDEDKIVVGQVVSVRQHLDADRLVLVTVNYGRGQIEVVTGAPNLRVGDVGQKVVFAMEGARLIDAYADTLKFKVLKRSKIRGVESAGMVCSEKELGISDEHTGIIILPDDAPVGAPFAQYWGDTVLDIELTPNLARCFSVAGVARDVAALLNVPNKAPAPELVAEGSPIEGQVQVIIQDPDLCPRYSAALIQGVTIAPSPQWMQRRLIMAGMRPINNIVDVTNYVMWEVGQPLHAFDYRLVRPCEPGGVPTIIVRRAAEGEQMTTLDGVEHTLTNQHLLITDGGGPVAVAGVMGGLDSEVTPQTVDVLLEAANFDFISVRRTSAQLRIPSEAAQRFGRGVDPELTLVALRRAADLMRQLAGGTVAQGFADAYPNPPAPKVIDLSTGMINRLLGVQLTADEIAGMLTRLGFGCQVLPGEDPVVRTSAPTFRQDVSIPADLAEEVARIYGYDRLPLRLIADEMPRQERNLELELEERARDVLVGAGLTEILSYSMTNLESIARLTPERQMPDGDAYIRLANPLTREHEYLRQTLMNMTLEALARNLRFVEQVKIFEIAHVYLPQTGQKLPDEPTRVCIALAGPREQRSWLSDAGAEMDFYDLKGLIETFCRHMGVRDISFAPAEHASFYPGRVAGISCGEQVLGVCGEVHPVVRQNFGLPEQRICLAELDLTAMIALAQPIGRFVPISRMPALKLDLALVVDEQVPADAISASLREVGGALLADAVLFDVYRGAQVGDGKKSLAYSLTFQALDKTLTSEEAVKQRERIVRQLQRLYGAEMRG